MHVRYPVWLRATGLPGASVFAVLFALESAARALLATVISVQALTVLGNTRDVSLAFSLVGLMGLVASFAIPFLVRRISRRLVYTLGTLLLVLCAVLLATVTVTGQIAGMLLRVFGVACLSITTSLYIMQYIRKKELTHSEPLRLQVSALAWTLGPWLGMKIYQSAGPEWAYAASAAAALLLLAFFWFQRLSDNPAIQAATSKPAPNPFASIRRFLAQPRLRLAWLITFGRSCWWVFFFVYAPLYMIRSGESEMAGALLVSAGNAVLFLSPVFGRLGARYGLRRVLTPAFLVAGFTTIAAGIAFDSPYVAAGFLLLGALACSALDAVGNIPFIRSVHPHERPQMTTVFRTYIDASELIPPLVFALILTFGDLQAVFLIFGVIMASFAAWPRFLPRRL